MNTQTILPTPRYISILWMKKTTETVCLMNTLLFGNEDGSPRKRRFDYRNQMDTIEFKSVLRETKLAWMLQFHTGHTSWFPKSRCNLNDKDNTLTLPIWLKLKKRQELKSQRRPLAPEKAKQEAQKLIDEGWYQISRKYCMLARFPKGKTGIQALDELPKENYHTGILGEGHSGDQYLRVHAPDKDKKTVSPEVFEAYLALGGGTYPHMHIKSQEQFNQEKSW